MNWFPDPDSQGRSTIDIPAGTDQAKFQAAQEACKQYDPGQGQGPAMSAEDFEKLRQVSQCMRDHGITGFPDPVQGKGIQLDPSKLGFKPGDPTFDKAQEECNKYAPLGDNGGAEHHEEGNP